MNINEKERLLCYAAGIMGSTLANPNHHDGVTDWLIRRSIRKAHKLISVVMDETKLNEVLNEDEGKAGA